MFQSTRPRGARRATSRHQLCSVRSFQSTRPRGARHQRAESRACCVSIHAPARGATADAHASALACFNPRARAGRDARSRIALNVSSTRRFNPRARAGRDDRLSCSYCTITEFQSTRPRGARRVARVSCAHASRRCFNPRARAGRDAPSIVSSRIGSFQSTRPRGARRPAVRGRAALRVSIHAPARGATARVPCRARTDAVSIHAPARGATSMQASDCSSRSMRFQSTRPRGARPSQHAFVSCGCRSFQSTRPRGARPIARGIA